MKLVSVAERLCRVGQSRRSPTKSRENTWWGSLPDPPYVPMTLAIPFYPWLAAVTTTEEVVYCATNVVWFFGGLHRLASRRRQGFLVDAMEKGRVRTVSPE